MLGVHFHPGGSGIINIGFRVGIEVKEYCHADRTDNQGQDHDRRTLAKPQTRGNCQVGIAFVLGQLLGDGHDEDVDRGTQVTAVTANTYTRGKRPPDRIDVHALLFQPENDRNHGRRGRNVVDEG